MASGLPKRIGMRFRSAQISLALHAAVLLALLHVGALQQIAVKQPEVTWSNTKLVYHMDRVPLPKPGGGGMRTETPPSRGELPQVVRRQIVPPTTRVPDHVPELPVPPSIEGPRETPPPVSALGLPGGQIGPPSDGPGRGPGIGTGNGRLGVGDGDGPAGPGIEARSFTGVTTPPVAIKMIEPEFSEDARKARLQGVVLILADIDERGIPVNIRVARPLGLGLDERAVDAVKQWRFRPGTRNGKPVKSAAYIEVNFRLL